MARLNEWLTYLGSVSTGVFSALTIQDISAGIGVIVSIAFTAVTYMQHRKTEKVKQEYWQLAKAKFNDALEFQKGASVAPDDLPKHISAIAEIIDNIETQEPTK
ncbi:hypothetical protein [Acerihabitans arboris]|uniref:Holin n=1 Tax=Acerihabitans arboris TaxID=2691583 RepID=A0A845SN66_9GAMM|nr:hypothetical protein [Acerihabitans arboris]NDL64832.1 hypothetical protein [Acerihabitans arboris]